MHIDQIIRRAHELSGVDDCTNNSWREGLEVLIGDYRDQNKLSGTGLGAVQELLSKYLAGRFQVDDYIARHPEVLDKAVERPVFILGAPRTGTTMASYLFNADPARRSLLNWEAFDLIPPAAPGMMQSDPRCLMAIARAKAAHEADRDIAVRHYEAADGPTECVHLFAQDFRTIMFDVYSAAPTYADWLLFCDMTSAYEHRKRVFQVLQSSNPGQWILKVPSDSLFIRTLFRVFPDAKVIWTHRDPYAVTGSIFSMRLAARKMFNDDLALEQMQRQYPIQLAMHLARPLEVSRERPNDFYHLYYDDLVADPMAQMRKIYAWLGDEFSDDAKANMARWVEENPQGRHGVHSYSLDQFGLSKEALTPYFSDYLKQHPVLTENV